MWYHHRCIKEWSEKRHLTENLYMLWAEDWIQCPSWEKPWTQFNPQRLWLQTHISVWHRPVKGGLLRGPSGASQIPTNSDHCLTTPNCGKMREKIWGTVFVPYTERKPHPPAPTFLRKNLKSVPLTQRAPSSMLSTCPSNLRTVSPTRAFPIEPPPLGRSNVEAQPTRDEIKGGDMLCIETRPLTKIQMFSTRNTEASKACCSLLS